MTFDQVLNQGKVVAASATDNLTIHGTTKEVTFDLEAKWTPDGSSWPAASRS